MAEHQLIGTMNPRCARCKRSLMDIVARPNIACDAQSLPFDNKPAALPAGLRSADRKRA